MKILYILFFLSGILVHSQELELSEFTPKKNKKFIIIDQDTTIVDEVKLDEVIIMPRLKFENRDDFRDYLILKRKTKKVWPYAVLAADRLETLNERLNTIESSRKRKKYTKVIQRYIEDEFTEELKKLTKTEGQILVKLMYRQTGITTFDLVKDLRSGWRAFWYNTTASMFNISLKEEYDPANIKEDFYIEDILQREFQDGKLENQPPKIEIDMMKLMNQWQEKKHLKSPVHLRMSGK
ncbi:MAG: DUF4294 domain-containing protein [Psychroflexus sp.]